VTGWFSANQVLIQTIFTNILFALSIQVPLRFGVFSFAGVGSYGIGGYAAAIVVTRYGWSLFPALAAAAVAGAVVGYLLALLLQRLNGLYLGMATIAFDLIISVLATNGGSLTGGAGGMFDVLINVSTLEIVLLTAVVLVLIAMTERGRVGRKINVVREDPELAAALGIDVRLMRRIAFVASGALGAVAGGLSVALETTISPGDINFSLVVLALTMIVVGGAASWLGGVIGAVVFTWLPTLLSFVGDWKGVIYGAIVAIVAVWVPGGLVGVTTDAHRAWQRRRAGSQSGRDLAVAADVPRPLEPLAAGDDLAAKGDAP
jgi:branched-chain amino acid transport system permease protein